ncbi:MAG: hypothetical protein ACP5O1_06755 [Phycisphaerae bacterium]
MAVAIYMSAAATWAKPVSRKAVPAFQFSAFLAARSHAPSGLPMKSRWLPDRRWSTFAYPEQSVQVRLIVRNSGGTAQTLDGELRWKASLADTGTRIRPYHTIWRTRIAKTVIAPHAGVAIRLILPVPQVGGYNLVWYDNHAHRAVARVTSIYRPTGLHTPVEQTHWITSMPRFAPGTPGPFFARSVANLIRLTGIKRYSLTLTTGDPVNTRQRLFAAALRAAGGRMLLRVIYPLTISAVSRLRYNETSRWLHNAMIELAHPEFVEPIFLIGPNHPHQKRVLMKKIFAADAAIVHADNAHILIASRWFTALPAKLQVLADALAVDEASTPVHPSPLGTVRKTLPIWALPGLLRQPQSDLTAARYLRSPAFVVAVAPPWKNSDCGWLIHLLGAGVWLENQKLPHWGVASIFQINNRSVAVISRIPVTDPRRIRTDSEIWLPNRVVGRNVFKDMLLRRYDEGSYVQFMDPDAAISVFNLGGRPIVPLYPGLPRVPAADAEAMLVSTESAASLLAALRTAVVRLEPHIISITICRHVPAVSAGRQPVAPSSGGAGKHRRWIKLVIEMRSQTPGKIQLAAVGGQNRYRLMEPALVTKEQKHGRLVIYLCRPRHMDKIIVVLRGQRRTWLATINVASLKNASQ